MCRKVLCRLPHRCWLSSGQCPTMASGRIGNGSVTSVLPSFLPMRVSAKYRTCSPLNLYELPKGLLVKTESTLLYSLITRNCAATVHGDCRYPVSLRRQGSLWDIFATLHLTRAAFRLPVYSPLRRNMLRSPVRLQPQLISGRHSLHPLRRSTIVRNLLPPSLVDAMRMPPQPPTLRTARSPDSVAVNLRLQQVVAS